MKNLLLGIGLILLLGLGGFVYRNAVEYPDQPIGCPVDALVCPDGTSLSRTGPSCSFPACPPPNVALAQVGIAFALSEGFTEVTSPQETAVVAYETAPVAPAEGNNIIIHRYAISSSTSAFETIRATAIGSPSDLPVSATSFSSTQLGTHRFTVVAIERFEGVVRTAYYLARATDVLRFDAVDRNVDWTNPALDVAALPTHVALRKLLTTLQLYPSVLQ